MRIKYNSPLILTYTLLSLVLIIALGVLNKRSHADLLIDWVSVGGYFYFDEPKCYFRLISHIFGHASFAHFFNNFLMILLLGPILEEKFGVKKLLLMILLTALVTGILQTLFFHTVLLGASGIVFMFIILISLSNFNANELPLTFVIICILFLGQEVFNGLTETNGQISQFAHILGGICGGFLGYFNRKK